MNHLVRACELDFIVVLHAVLKRLQEDYDVEDKRQIDLTLIGHGDWTELLFCGQDSKERLALRISNKGTPHNPALAANVRWPVEATKIVWDQTPDKYSELANQIVRHVLWQMLPERRCGGDLFVRSYSIGHDHMSVITRMGRTVSTVELPYPYYKLFDELMKLEFIEGSEGMRLRVNDLYVKHGSQTQGGMVEPSTFFKELCEQLNPD